MWMRRRQTSCASPLAPRIVLPAVLGPAGKRSAGGGGGHALNDLHRFGALLLVTNQSACTINTNDVLNLLSHECRKEAFLVWLRSATSAALVESASKDGAVSPHAQVMVRKV